jgi:hypothetical protein
VHFGVWCDVVAAGPVRLGEPVMVATTGPYAAAASATASGTDYTAVIVPVVEVEEVDEQIVMPTPDSLCRILPTTML